MATPTWHEFDGAIFLGITANPPTLAHAGLAVEAARQTKARKVVVAPAGEHPEKNLDVAFKHRLAMTHLVIGEKAGHERDRILVSEVDNRPGKCWTVDTLSLLEEMLSLSVMLAIGSDQLRHFNSWRHSEVIRSRHGVLIWERPHNPIDHDLVQAGMQVIPAPLLDGNSGAAREAAKGGDFDTLKGVVGSSVAGYIRENRLYGWKQ